MTRDQELWGVALWLEKAHGERGYAHIESQVARLTGLGDDAGVAMWRAVEARYDKLRTLTAPN